MVDHCQVLYFPKYHTHTKSITNAKLFCDASSQKQAKHLLEEALDFQTRRFNFVMSKPYKIKP